MTINPLFTKILQIGFVVRDLEKSVRNYWEVSGIGPWAFYTMDPSNMLNTKVHGKDVKFSMKVALADLAGLQIELIQPLEGQNIYTEFLDEHGEGIHHIACAVDDFDETIITLKKKGVNVIQEGITTAGLGFAYLDIRNDMACITEIYKIPSDATYPPPEKVYP
jgi:methylmalonyl-CoA/ethylmalonyl-CoA epimerase